MSSCLLTLFLWSDINMATQLKHIPGKEDTYRLFAERAFIARLTYDELLTDMLAKDAT